MRSISRTPAERLVLYLNTRREEDMTTTVKDANTETMMDTLKKLERFFRHSSWAGNFDQHVTLAVIRPDTWNEDILAAIGSAADSEEYSRAIEYVQRQILQTAMVSYAMGLDGASDPQTYEGLYDPTMPGERFLLPALFNER